MAWGPSSLEETTEIWGAIHPLSMSTVDGVHEHQIKMSILAGQDWTSWELGVRFSSPAHRSPHNSRLLSFWASFPDLETSLSPLGRFWILGPSTERQSPGKR